MCQKNPATALLLLVILHDGQITHLAMALSAAVTHFVLSPASG